MKTVSENVINNIIKEATERGANPFAAIKIYLKYKPMPPAYQCIRCKHRAQAYSDHLSCMIMGVSADPESWVEKYNGCMVHHNGEAYK